MGGFLPYYLWVATHAITGAIIALILMPLIRNMLQEAGVVVQNYRQNQVVNMVGLVIVVGWIIMMVLAVLAGYIVDIIEFALPPGFLLGPDIAIPLTIIVLGAGVFGILDDKLGSREHSGFRGHFGALRQGRLTTGALKALGIPLVALVAVALTSPKIFDWFGNAMLIALFVNTINLLDLRPGRALKVFIPLQIIILAVSISALGTVSATMLGIALALIGPDLREEIMLGDTGANVLGGVLGFCASISFDWPIKLALIVILIFVQIVAERVSISQMIERVSVLRVLDNLGRRT